MSAKPEAAAATAAPPKSKKMLLIIVAVVVLALGGGGAAFFLAKKNAAHEEDDDEEVVAAVAHPAPSGPPAYLPLENMVVNLADPGGEKVAQVGVTLELTDAQGQDKVKAYLPTIRSDILLLLSQRTSQELLLREGKEKLANDILAEASRHFGPPVVRNKDDVHAPTAAPKKKKAGAKPGQGANPVRGVLFSSFIVQ